MVLPTQEVHTLTQNQDLAQLVHDPILGHLAVHTLVPIHDHHRTLEEAEAKVGIIVHAPDLMDIIDLGHGHLPIDVTTQGQDLLRHLGDSLPINVMCLRAKQNVNILIDSEKFRHLMT